MNWGLPLPLELTKPVLLAGDLDSEVRGEQMCSGTRLLRRGGSASLNALGIIQVDGETDVQVDDVIA